MRPNNKDHTNHINNRHKIKESSMLLLWNRSNVEYLSIT